MNQDDPMNQMKEKEKNDFLYFKNVKIFHCNQEKRKKRDWPFVHIFSPRHMGERIIRDDRQDFGK